MGKGTSYMRTDIGTARIREVLALPGVLGHPQTSRSVAIYVLLWQLIGSWEKTTHFAMHNGVCALKTLHRSCPGIDLQDLWTLCVLE